MLWLGSVGVPKHLSTQCKRKIIACFWRKRILWITLCLTALNLRDHAKLLGWTMHCRRSNELQKALSARHVQSLSCSFLNAFPIQHAAARFSGCVLTLSVSFEIEAAAISCHQCKIRVRLVPRFPSYSPEKVPSQKPCKSSSTFLADPKPLPGEVSRRTTGALLPCRRAGTSMPRLLCICTCDLFLSL